MKDLHHAIIGGIATFLVHSNIIFIISPAITDKCISVLASIIAGVITGLLSKLINKLIVNKPTGTTINSDDKEKNNNNNTIEEKTK